MINKLKSTVKLFFPKYQKLILDYKIDMKPRYGYGKPPHQLLYNIVVEEIEVYKSFLHEILKYEDVFKKIKSSENEKDINQPSWNNGYLPGLDIITLYTMLAYFKPKNYIEVGSGNSTKVARKSIVDNNLETKVTSIDPFPRANIDHLADVVIRKPFENIADYKPIIDSLNEGDILFIDNSHRCLPNSDATTVFLDILPYLKKGVIVHIHDIYIPFDYPQFMCDRFYSEQYVLAAFILANPQRYRTIFPGIFVSESKELSSLIGSIWEHKNTKNVEQHGGSYWIKIG
jgi:hypothetical protein